MMNSSARTRQSIVALTLIFSFWFGSLALSAPVKSAPTKVTVDESAAAVAAPVQIEEKLASENFENQPVFSMNAEDGKATPPISELGTGARNLNEIDASKSAIPASTAKADSADQPLVDPVNKSKEAKEASTGTFTWRFALTCIFLALLLGGGYWAIKKWSYRGHPTHRNQHQIKVLSQHFLAPKRSLMMIRVAGETLLIGSTEHNVTLIKSLSLLDEEVPEETPSSFNGVLSKSIKHQNATSDDHEENFALAGLNEIRDRVSKKLHRNNDFEG